ncbi:ParB/RepB/Spo0J family partition protein [Enterobacter hormaechei]
MTVADVKSKAPKKTSKNKTAGNEALKAALDAAVIEYVPLTDLIKSPLNVRTIPYTTESVKRLANSIESLGLLHNLVVHALPEGKYGVAAGGRRLTALTLMSEMGRIKPDYQVPVKRVSDELAVEASYAENNELETMHPAEQITAFGTLAAQGKTPAQIGEVLGYGSRHVQRMLKLASLAPSLLALLAEGQLDVEQCQVLCLESDPERQVAVYESVKEEWGRTTVNALKNRITEREISVSHPRFAFIGREVYEAAGGIVREDLFSEQEGDGTVDSLLVERLVLEKLELIAREIHQKEGWMWGTGRLAAINLYGPDGKDYRILPEPDAIYSEDDSRRIDELSDKFNALDPDSDEAEVISSEISLIEHAAELRGWTEDLKAKSGVVVSFMHGALRIQRGICRMSDLPDHDSNGEDSAQSPAVTHMHRPDAAEGISIPLLTKMSSERTLAVQAALMQQPEKAVALMVWRMCTCVFAGCVTTPHPFRINLTVSHSSLTENAPSGKEGAAFEVLMTEKERLKTLLPAGWEKDFTTFFALNGEVLMSLLAFCAACSVDGVQTRDNGHTSRSPLDTVEAAIGFHLRDWWQPTKENYFGSLKHSQIVTSLKDAGLTGAAADAEKMKKGDAAVHAEFFMKQNRWVPAWLQSPQPDAKDSTDTDTDNAAIAA